MEIRHSTLEKIVILLEMGVTPAYRFQDGNALHKTPVLKFVEMGWLLGKKYVMMAQKMTLDVINNVLALFLNFNAIIQTSLQYAYQNVETEL